MTKTISLKALRYALRSRKLFGYSDMELARIVDLANMFNLNRAGTYYYRGSKVKRVKFYSISRSENPYKLIAQVKREFPNVEVEFSPVPYWAASLSFRFKAST